MKDDEILYDQNGFIQLIYKAPARGRPTGLAKKLIELRKQRLVPVIPDEGGRIGQMTLRYSRSAAFDDTDPEQVSLTDTTILNHEQFSIPNGAKSWQWKAWKYLSGQVDWSSPSPTKNAEGSVKLRHLKGVAICLKVVATGNRAKKDVVLDSLESGKRYYIATTKSQMERLFNNILHMSSREMKELYAAKSTKAGHTCVKQTAKVLMVYDDKSYDCFQGNPVYMITLLKPLLMNRRVIL